VADGTKAVLDTKPTSVYDDDLSQHYHFPRRYLAIVQQCVGDWIILRRPRADGGNLAYFATARVQTIEADSSKPGMSYARLTEYLQFDRPVPWTIEGRYSEAPLRNIPQSQVGVYLRGRSVRPLSESDFTDIVAMGLGETLDVHNAERLGIPVAIVHEAEVAIHQPLAVDEHKRRVEFVLTNRVIREASFRNGVYRAYDNCCALTGLRILDARGNSEVQAAHIWAVADGGPDVLQNGIALTATVHWLFDHHLISITDDYHLILREERIPPGLRVLLGRIGEKIRLPTEATEWPHPTFLKRHRDRFFATADSKC
jgi:putative restriction endonuclease